MKNLILFSGILLLCTACETGKKHENNSSTLSSNKTIIIDDIPVDELYDDDPTHSESYYIDQGEDDYAAELAVDNSELLDDILQIERVEEVVKEEPPVEVASQHFEGGSAEDNLEIKSIRKANHDHYVRLVFDSDGMSKKVSKVGKYEVDNNPSKKSITVVFNGYGKFSATFPTFDGSTIVKKMAFVHYLDDNGYKIKIDLKESSTIKVMALESPARLVIDVQKP